MCFLMSKLSIYFSYISMMFIVQGWQNVGQTSLRKIFAGKAEQKGELCFDDGQTTHKIKPADSYDSPPACWPVFSL